MTLVDPHKRKPPFRSPGGKYWTQSLFLEWYDPTKSIDPVFTMKEYDHEYNGVTYPSFSRLFLEVGDPTGYLFAKEYLGSYKHWQELNKSKWFRDFLDEILVELEVQQKAMGLRKIKEVAMGESGQAFNASKFLAKEGWEPNEPKKRGRPSKSEVAGELKKQALLEEELNEDLSRILN